MILSITSSPHHRRLARMIEEGQRRIDGSSEAFVSGVFHGFGGDQAEFGDFVGVELDDLEEAQQKAPNERLGVTQVFGC